MPSDPTRQVRRANARADTKERAHVLAAKLERNIAATADQRAVLTKAFEHPIVVEPHRDHHAYTLGADAFYCGLATGDAHAMMGLMSTGPANVARLLLDAAKAAPNIYVTRLWPRIIDANRDEYEARGRYVSWQRRWARYKEDHDDFVDRNSSGDDSWRDLHMTSGQRHLVQDSAVMLDIDIPEAMTRGRAHDWLMRHGANVVYRKGAVS
ncbi:MAG: hypothetical protein H2054_09005 [Sphingomonas sp.]|uniref:hypothetical protein n=1 Tax=Sphingomonas sp. TaxID=28214 RepID=UPI00184C11F8|nr:hypothetical protein [Sphingomonas sp.]